jgi:hypothetical protein
MQPHYVVHSDSTEFASEDQALGRRDDRLPRPVAPRLRNGLV